MLTTTVLTVLVIGGAIYSHLTGARMYRISQAKLTAGDQARHTLSLLVREVRGAKDVRIGTGNLTSFTEAADGSAQQGSAMQLQMGSATNSYIRYFYDASKQTLNRMTNGSNVKDVIAEYVTNSIVFTSESDTGVMNTERDAHRIIGLTLQFRQVQFPVTVIGAGQLYDFYQLRTKITRRMIE